MNQYTQIQYIRRKSYYDVIVYYSKNGEKFRPSTGVKVDLKHLLDSGNISSKHPNLENDLAKIKNVQDRVENLVSLYKDKYKEKPPIDWLEKEFEKPIRDAKKDLQDVFCYWEDFITEKKSTTRADGTINRYNSLKQSITAFGEKKNYALSFEALDQLFFNALLFYLVNEHEHVRNVHMRSSESATMPEIGISNETAIKKLKDFTEYLKYCTVEFDVPINLEKIKKYIALAKHKEQVRPLSKTQKWELTLTTDEIGFAVNLEYHEPDYWKSLSVNQRRYLEILIFMCLQGTAPIDTKSIIRTDIKNGKIVKERSKTGNEFKVELDPIAEDILERNNYNLNFTDQTLNSELKRMFVTIFELYRDYYFKKNKEAYEIICTQKVKKGEREILLIQHKGLFVELMTGRRSFLTNLGEMANEVGLKEAMDKAGHVKVATTVGYIHERQQAKKKNENLFGIKKLRR
jgi:hypothetical protein